MTFNSIYINNRLSFPKSRRPGKNATKLMQVKCRSMQAF